MHREGRYKRGGVIRAGLTSPLDPTLRAGSIPPTANTVVALALTAVTAWDAYLYATAAEAPGALLMVIGMLVGLLCSALAAKLAR